MTLDWGYNQNNGPSTWKKCYPEAAGHRQSPVDIKPVNLKTIQTNRKLTWRYIAEHTEDVINTGTNWKVNVNGKGSELYGGPLEGKYILEQFHCHWGESNDQGSEHTVNGTKYAGELHLVHWNASKYKNFEDAANYPDGLCVLGVFLKPGRKHNELDKIVQKLHTIEYKNQISRISVPLNPSLFLPADSSYFTYQGSLTTPPCSECVIWIVFKDPVQVSHSQLEAFRKLKSYSSEDTCKCDDEFKGFVKTNFRPTVPLGKREIIECRQ